MIETKLFMLLTSIIADLGSYKYAPNNCPEHTFDCRVEPYKMTARLDTTSSK
jgi:hypothetical protein